MNEKANEIENGKRLKWRSDGRKWSIKKFAYCAQFGGKMLIAIFSHHSCTLYTAHYKPNTNTETYSPFVFFLSPFSSSSSLPNELKYCNLPSGLSKKFANHYYKSKKKLDDIEWIFLTHTSTWSAVNIFCVEDSKMSVKNIADE